MPQIMQYDGCHSPTAMSCSVIKANEGASGTEVRRDLDEEQQKPMEGISSSDSGLESSSESSSTSKAVTRSNRKKLKHQEQSQSSRSTVLLYSDTVVTIVTIATTQLVVYLQVKNLQLVNLEQITHQLIKLVDKMESTSTIENQKLLKSLLEESQRQSEIATQTQTAATSNSSKAWQPCTQLRHYRQDPRQPRHPQLVILKFMNRPFDAERYAPAGIPSNRADMHNETNRLATFEDVRNSDWTTTEISRAVRRALARAGWFRSDATGSLCCAYCYGRVEADQARRSFASYVGGDDTFWPMQMHQERFGTCPFVLQLDVGNKSDCLLDQAALKAPVSCTEEDSQQDDSTAAGWRRDSVADSISSESEARRQLRLRPGLPTESLAAAQMACDPRAEQNLQLLERSLRKDRTIAQTYHPPRYPDMTDASAREATLIAVASIALSNVEEALNLGGKSAEIPLPTDSLAAAGFFHHAEVDKAGCAVCYWCGLRLRHWLPEDEPWIEHARWSPRCCHLLLERGAEFVLESRRLHPPYLPEEAELLVNPVSSATPRTLSKQSTASARSTAPAVIIDHRIEPRQLRARDDIPAMLLLRRLVDRSDAKTAVAEQLRRTGGDFASSQMLLSATLNVAERRQELNIAAGEYHDRRLAELDQATQVDAAELAADSEMDWRACKVCMDRQINVILADCGHYCCCSNCSRSLTVCPVCRASIRATLLIRDDNDLAQ